MTRDEMAAYQRKRRAERPDVRAYDIAFNRARQQALSQLAREYPTRYTELLDAFRGHGQDTPAITRARRAVLRRQGS